VGTNSDQCALAEQKGQHNQLICFKQLQSVKTCRGEYVHHTVQLSCNLDARTERPTIVLPSAGVGVHLRPRPHSRALLPLPFSALVRVSFLLAPTGRSSRPRSNAKAGEFLRSCLPAMQLAPRERLRTAMNVHGRCGQQN
jgi:hypothetical protein